MSTTAHYPRSVPSQKLRSSSKAKRLDPSPSNQSWQSANGAMLDSKTRRILIVDDDPDVLKLVSRMVTCLGCFTDAAGNAIDALFHLNRKHYDLVLTDYQMPYVDGHQLADQIKKRYAGINVIIMTGHCEERIKCMLDASDAVDGILLKPFNLSTLKDKIEAVGRSRGARLTRNV